MTRDTYERALKSAAQVALVSLIAGCGATAGESSTTASSEEGSGQSASEELRRSDKSCGHGHMSDAQCVAAIHAAYPNGDPNWFGQPTPPVSTSTSTATLASCCEQVFLKDGGTDYSLRDTGCCSILKLTNAPDIGIACTPWGPPMPVAMRRRGLA